LCLISNGSVSLPLWKEINRERYSGNETMAVYVQIHNSITLVEEPSGSDTVYVPPETVVFSPVIFVNGSAAVSWNGKISRPDYLTSSATLQDALRTLEEIIANQLTPEGTKSVAQMFKDAIILIRCPGFFVR
jgi:hypothetical protein